MTIATLRSGQELERMFARTRKDRLLSRSASP
jgi:hypothetical protein